MGKQHLSITEKSLIAISHRTQAKAPQIDAVIRLETGLFLTFTYIISYFLNFKIRITHGNSKTNIDKHFTIIFTITKSNSCFVTYI